jgi:NADH-quinone oxidoreductase subunit G
MTTNGSTPTITLAPAPEMVSIVIDGKTVSVPKGTNVIDAAKVAGVEIPHYCYHPHLSVAGNCRMCQVKVKGGRKLEIACNMQVMKDGMEIETHHTSKEVADTQAAVLEFILINHPLDCTVCDQAGHCKLQDYHYEYNARSSRFLEEKEHKPKNVPLGPTVMLDAERCIMCTRCVRFCDEIPQTSELGMLNRGDRSTIAVNPGKELNNPLSGTVVDLCPVGALTHKEWRFNTRIWFTEQHDAICPGCSTGCSVKVAERDGEIVHVKARHNPDVNKEWLCDEGRYGFHRFLPKERVTAPLMRGTEVSLEAALTAIKQELKGPVLFMLSPDLTLEDMYGVKLLTERAQALRGSKVVLGYKERALTPVEAILISPDYAANFQGGVFSGLVGGDLGAAYATALQEIQAGTWSHVVLVGDRAIAPEDISEKLVSALRATKMTVALVADNAGKLVASSHVVLPARTILEKSGLLINRRERLQYTQRIVTPSERTEPHWRLLHRIGEVLGVNIIGAHSDREATLAYLVSEPRLAGVTIAAIKRSGIDLRSYRPGIVPPGGSLEGGDARGGNA